jgi:RNA-directed DNA polymerase
MKDSTDPNHTQPSSVPATAQQDGEIFARWAWTEGSVWTARMLMSLEQGVKGGVWFRLIDKVFSERNLQAAGYRVCANKGAPGVDHVTVEAFEQHWDDNIRQLAEDLRKETYRPQAIRRTYIPKPGSTEPRPLGIPTVCS